MGLCLFWGHSRRSGRVPTTSDLPSATDFGCMRDRVRSVPIVLQNSFWITEDKFFGSLKTNFPGCGRCDRIIVRGATATSDELTGNFSSALEDTSIGDYRV